MSLSLTPSLSGALYDDWFEDELGEDRRDLELGLEVLLTWTLAPNHVTLTGGVTFTRNYSTLPDNEFSRLDATPTLGLTLTF